MTCLNDRIPGVDWGKIGMASGIYRGKCHPFDRGRWGISVFEESEQQVPRQQKKQHQHTITFRAAQFPEPAPSAALLPLHHYLKRIYSKIK
jgi:hypothetical protein